MQRIFLDTEFSSLNDDAELMSVGLIAEDGSTFYREVSGWRYSKLSEFCYHSVLPLLTSYNPQSAAEVGEALRKWLLERGSSIIATDSLRWDWMWFNFLLGSNRPDNVHPEPLLLTMNYLNNFYQFEQALKEFFETHTPHHALNDAMANKYAWEKSGGDVDSQ